jgi:hypothetical protein
MKPLRCLAACALGACALFSLACGRDKTPPAEARDPAVYARNIKQLVNEFNAGNPAGAPKQAAVLLETLEVYKSQPVGAHEAIYAELTERCRELSTAKGAGVGKKLDDMAVLVKKLP